MLQVHGNKFEYLSYDFVKSAKVKETFSKGLLAFSDLLWVFILVSEDNPALKVCQQFFRCQSFIWRLYASKNAIEILLYVITVQLLFFTTCS